MALDKEQQARQTFLAEAETYFGEIEAVLLGLKTAEDRTDQINIAMRAAHSIKGTAGMRGFMAMSQLAHNLEDSFKILRVRQLSVDTHLETLLLQGLDWLRVIRQRYQEEQPIDSQWLADGIEPIFTQLNQRLGELTPEDEARLLSEDNNSNLDFVIFTTSVEDCLEEFEQELSQLRGDGLRQAVVKRAKQLSEFGLMAQLESFVTLCQNVQVQCVFAQFEDIGAIARQAMKVWQRSHSLVLLGRTERLPTELPLLKNAGDNSLQNLAELSLPDISADAQFDLPGISADDIDHLHDQLASLEIAGDLPTGEKVQFSELIPHELDHELAELEGHTIPPVAPSAAPVTELTTLQGELAALRSEPVSDPPTATAVSQNTSTPPWMSLSAPPQPAAPKPKKSSTVRVAVDQLKQINGTVESLVLDRNAVNLKLKQLQAFSALMQERMVTLASFNKELRQWYDQASTEGLVVGEDHLPEWSSPNGSTQYGMGISKNGLKNVAMSAPDNLDALELDRYSKLHLLAQEHMETIVKLEEVSRDIELGLNDIGQAVGSLNYTSRTLKNQITQTQMRPFEEIVGRFPRVVRDWSVQYSKPVDLRIEGATTPMEQFVLYQLSDPLIHLLRNAFDHGIESPEVRRARQKPAVGSIVLRALNRGNRVVIILEDDGAGIDMERIRDRIRQYNLPTDQVDKMEHQELLSFIFEPGFSTSRQVTELSGRGVGMDVVRTNLKELRGDIQVTTELGQGTQFTITIPLSLSILRVMLLERSGSVFALPVDMVQEVIGTPTIELTQPSMTWKNESIPLVRLEDHWTIQTTRLLEMSGQPLINSPMVIVVGEGKSCYGLAIDRFWQEQEVAIRPVASPIPLPPGFSGVTVLGDGRVVPLIEPIQLMDWIGTGPEQTPLQPTSLPTFSTPNTTRILVVDDSIHARRYLATTLERSGYLVEQAKDGRDAVDKLLAGLRVEAVICDIEMPRLDGYGVLEELRDLSDFSELPILMLTSRTNEKHRKLAMNLGATAYFSKPYNEQELLKQLKQFTKTIE